MWRNDIIIIMESGYRLEVNPMAAHTVAVISELNRIQRQQLAALIFSSAAGRPSVSWQPGRPHDIAPSVHTYIVGVYLPTCQCFFSFILFFPHIDREWTEYIKDLKSKGISLLRYIAAVLYKHIESHDNSLYPMRIMTVGLWPRLCLRRKKEK